MREILFRGKCNEIGKLYGQWLQGFYAEDNGKPLIAQCRENGIVGSFCDPNSIGQYTGMNDKSGEKKIFEGDIVSTVDGNYLIVCDDYTGFHFEMRRELTGGYIKLESLSFYDCEVIGNIHDNPELLGSGTKCKC